MRKHLAFVLAVAMLLTLVACNGNGGTTSSEPTPTDPNVTVPSYTYPSYTDPSYTYPSYTDPTYTYPSYTDPTYIDPNYTYPSFTYTDPFYTDPTYSEPTSTTPSERVPTSSSRPRTTYRPRTTGTVPGYVEPTQPSTPVATDPSQPAATDPTQPGVTDPTTPGEPAADHEEPVAGEVKWELQHSSVDETAEEMRQQILNMPDTIKPSADGVTYYVSFKGNDANDGLSPETAWRSTYRVGQLPSLIRDNSTLLFERGGVYRGQMQVRDGMSIGAYGNSALPKPQLYGGPKNFADESFWTQTDTPNVWKVDIGTANGKLIEHVGNIIFNHGEEYSSPGLCFAANELKKDFDYYHDIKNAVIYLYHSEGNPGGMYDSIEIAPRGAVLRRYERDTVAENVTIENLCIRYSCYGVSFATVENFKITGCEIGNIGGSMLPDFDLEKNNFVAGSEMVRYGNGIEFYGDQKSALVEYNWVYQCFDAGYTNQGGSLHENITVRNNLFEYSPYNIEAWTDPNGLIRNTVYENNILRFSGFGFGNYQRVGSSDEKTAHINNNCSRICKSENFVIRNNVFDTGKFGLISGVAYDGVNGPKYEGNTWIQQSKYPVLKAKMPGDEKISLQSGGSLAAMQAAILPIDPTAKIIYE